METKSHWENIYAIKVPSEVSWFQEHPTVSRGLIRRTGVAPSVSIIDVGGGASTLVDDLLADGFQNLTMLDISAAALQIARERLGPQAAAAVTWLEADITSVRLPAQRFDVWHDRAVFHFLTRKEDRRKYMEAVRQAVKPGGHVIVATFSPAKVVTARPDRAHTAPVPARSVGNAVWPKGPAYSLPALLESKKFLSRLHNCCAMPAKSPKR